MILAEGVVAPSYFARWARAPISDTNEPEPMYVTSIWRPQLGACRNVFSQDTVSRGEPVLV